MKARIRIGAALLASVVGIACGTAARADEPLFGFVNTTDVLPKGQQEVEQWASLRHGRTQGDFDVWEGGTEYSRGVTDAFQLSLYANYARAQAFHNAPDGVTSPPESFADFQPGPDDHFDKSRFIGVSVEGVYRFTSPYTAPLGLALYVEPTVGPNLRELETRLIAQKNFRDDRLVLAANLTLAQELRHLPGDPDADPDSKAFVRHWDRETDVNVGVAASYRFAPNWSAGGEFLNEREWTGFNPLKSSQRTNVAFYAGPTIHYGGRKFFVTGTFLVQLPWARDEANPRPGFIVHGFTNADDFERYRLRLKAGWNF